MGYSHQAARQIQSLATLFRDRAQDQAVFERLAELAGSHERWSDAHREFDLVRRSFLATEDAGLQAEYFFVETCLKTLYNESSAGAPFDSVSPFFVLPAAVGLAKLTGMTLEELAEAIQ